MKGWVWGNSGRRSTSAISILWRTNESCFLSNLHASKAFVPTFNHLTLSNCKSKGAVSVLIGVKLFSSLESSSVESVNFLTFLRRFSLTLSMNNFGKLSLYKHNSILFCFLFSHYYEIFLNWNKQILKIGEF